LDRRATRVLLSASHPGSRSERSASPAGATATAGLQVSGPGNFGTACFLPGPQGQAGKLPYGGRALRLPAGSVHLQDDPFPFYACHGTAPAWTYAKPVEG
jgi:hypothetical protein